MPVTASFNAVSSLSNTQPLMTYVELVFAKFLVTSLRTLSSLISSLMASKSLSCFSANLRKWEMILFFSLFIAISSFLSDYKTSLGEPDNSPKSNSVTFSLQSFSINSLSVICAAIKTAHSIFFPLPNC